MGRIYQSAPYEVDQYRKARASSEYPVARLLAGMMTDEALGRAVSDDREDSFEEREFWPTLTAPERPNMLRLAREDELYERKGWA